MAYGGLLIQIHIFFQFTMPPHIPYGFLVLVAYNERRVHQAWVSFTPNLTLCPSIAPCHRILAWSIWWAL